MRSLEFFLIVVFSVTEERCNSLYALFIYGVDLHNAVILKFETNFYLRMTQNKTVWPNTSQSCTQKYIKIFRPTFAFNEHSNERFLKILKLRISSGFALNTVQSAV